MKRALFLLTFLSAAIFPSAASSYSVGSLHGEFSVGSLGGAQYVLPIEVPSGPCGIGPTVALAYSSQSGNGPAYLFTIGIQSAKSASNQYNVDVNGITTTSHKMFWTEQRGSLAAFNYFNRYYGVDITVFRKYLPQLQ